MNPQYGPSAPFPGHPGVPSHLPPNGPYAPAQPPYPGPGGPAVGPIPAQPGGGFLPAPSPRRKRSPIFYIMLAGLPLAGLALAAAVLVFTSSIRPKMYLEEWADGLGTPYGFQPTYTQIWDHNKAVSIIYKGYCGDPQHACRDVPKNLLEWTSSALNVTMTEKDVGDCFHDGCVRTFLQEGHSGKLQILEVPSRPNASSVEFRFDVELRY